MGLVTTRDSSRRRTFAAGEFAEAQLVVKITRLVPTSATPPQV
jgi:hypothetical protein